MNQTPLRPFALARRLAAVSAAFLAVGAALAAAAPAQEVEPGIETFVETVDVNVVEVDVYVTDRKGRSIAGLSLEDFEVLEDGKPVPITNFAFVDRSPEPSPVPATTETSPEPAEPQPAPEAEGLHLIVYVDNHNILPQNRNRVLPEVQRFLRKSLAPGDRAMVVSYGQNLRIDQAFTDDMPQLEQALKRLKKADTGLMMMDAEARYAASELGRADDNTIDDALRTIDMLGKQREEDANLTLRVLRDFVTSLSGLPGRKALVYVSDGIPLDETSTKAAFRRLAEASNAHQVTFYTIDARGPSQDAAMDATSSQTDTTRFVNAIANPGLTEALQYMAETTGGFAVTNTYNVGGGLERVARDLDSFYSIGYDPSRSSDGKYHEIKVRLKGAAAGERYRVRHREGYLDKTGDERMADRTLAALTFPPMDNPLGLSLEMGEPQTLEGGREVVQVLVKIPLGRLTLIPRDGIAAGKVRLMVALMVVGGKLLPIEEVDVPIQLPEAELTGADDRSLAYPLLLPLPEQGLRVSVGAEDSLSGLRSYSRAGHEGA